MERTPAEDAAERLLALNQWRITLERAGEDEAAERLDGEMSALSARLYNALEDE